MPNSVLDQLKSLRDTVAQDLRMDPRYRTLQALDKSIAEISGVLSSAGLLPASPPPASLTSRLNSLAPSADPLAEPIDARDAPAGKEQAPGFKGGTIGVSQPVVPSPRDVPASEQGVTAPVLFAGSSLAEVTEARAGDRVAGVSEAQPAHRPAPMHEEDASARQPDVVTGAHFETTAESHADRAGSETRSEEPRDGVLDAADTHRDVPHAVTGHEAADHAQGHDAEVHDRESHHSEPQDSELEDSGPHGAASPFMPADAEVEDEAKADAVVSGAHENAEDEVAIAHSEGLRESEAPSEPAMAEPPGALAAEGTAGSEEIIEPTAQADVSLPPAEEIVAIPKASPAEATLADSALPVEDHHETSSDNTGHPEGHDDSVGVEPVLGENHPPLPEGQASGYIPVGPRQGAGQYAPSISVKFSKLPGKVDLRPLMPAIDTSGSAGSAVISAVVSAYECWIKKASKRDQPVSRLFAYYNARWRDGLQDVDAGCTIQGALEGLQRFGGCAESVWPFGASDVTRRPNAAAYQDAAASRIHDMARVPLKVEVWKQALAEGKPITFGIQVFPGFADCAAAGGLVAMPDPAALAHTPHAVHALCAVGYSEGERVFIVRNAWGQEFGDGGYCYLPYEYALNPIFNDGDCWVFVPKIPAQPPRETWLEDGAPVIRGGKGADGAKTPAFDVAAYAESGVDLFEPVRRAWNPSAPPDYEAAVNAVAKGQFAELEVPKAAAVADGDARGAASTPDEEATAGRRVDIDLAAIEAALGMHDLMGDGADEPAAETAHGREHEHETH